MTLEFNPAGIHVCSNSTVGIGEKRTQMLYPSDGVALNDIALGLRRIMTIWHMEAFFLSLQAHLRSSISRR